MIDALLAALAGVAAGALNAIGGGGTFVALPALVGLGLAPVTANAVSRVALGPGALASVWASRHHLEPIAPASTKALTVASVAGGAAGAALLVILPDRSFGLAAPWLLAFATLVLAVGRPVVALLQRRRGRRSPMGARSLVLAQFCLAVYGGYFGGAVGIFMIALWSAGTEMSIAASNPMRITQLGAIYAGASVVLLNGSGALAVPLYLVAMLLGAVVGGWAGAQLARRLPGRLLHAILLVTAATTRIWWRSIRSLKASKRVLGGRCANRW